MIFRKLFIFTFLTCVVASCSLADKFAGREVVARVGNKVLYKTETDNILPLHVSKEDSIAIVRQYINLWAINQLMVLKAEEELPKQERNVEKQLEEYKTQLLAYRYESMYISQRLDTLVSENELMEYYENHNATFVTNSGVMKGRMLKISNSSPNLRVIQKQLLSEESVSETGTDEIGDVVMSSVSMYKNYNNDWIDVNLVAKDAGVESDRLLESLKKGKLFEHKDSLFTTMVQSLEFVQPGKIAPFEYYKEKIKDIIISKRKQNLEAELQRDILNEALNDKKLKIIENESN